MPRPRKHIDKDNFEKLCGLFCTLTDIAAFFNVSEDTVERWCKRTYHVGFAEIYKKLSAAGRTSLRRWQFQAAERGNTSLLIFLGKNYLGQADVLKTETDADGKLADLIDGLKEPLQDGNVHDETEGIDASVADEQTEEA